VRFIPSYSKRFSKKAFHFLCGSPFLKWSSELDPSLLSLIRVVGYTKMLLYAIFEWKKKTFFKIKKFTSAR